MAKVGRPRTFNRDDALTKAMHVFWERGYEGTTMADLSQSIGMKAPSIYAAFGNKDAIFKEVVSHYLPTVVSGQLAALNNTANIQQAVENALDECVRLFTNKDNPQTCLIMTAAINASPEHQEHVESLKGLRNDYKKAWEARFERAKQDGQLKSELSPQQLAEYFSTLVQGMALRAKDGATRENLLQTSQMAISVLR